MNSKFWSLASSPFCIFVISNRLKCALISGQRNSSRRHWKIRTCDRYTVTQGITRIWLIFDDWSLTGQHNDRSDEKHIWIRLMQRKTVTLRDQRSYRSLLNQSNHCDNAWRLKLDRTRFDDQKDNQKKDSASTKENSLMGMRRVRKTIYKQK